MTTIYVPRLIESTEQAEALHEKAIIITYSPRGEAWEAALREDVDAEAITPDGGWYCQTLVPIEAEEETVRSLHLDGRMDGFTFEEGDELPEHFYDGPPRTRYVTPWEEA